MLMKTFTGSGGACLKSMDSFAEKKFKSYHQTSNGNRFCKLVSLAVPAKAPVPVGISLGTPINVSVQLWYCFSPGLFRGRSFPKFFLYRSCQDENKHH